jgi:two-component system, OmpR family, response regulator
MKHGNLVRIMYIEDEPDIIEIAKIALEDIGGFTLECCRSGSEAVKKAAEFKPDLFLIDVMMPQMDGPATLRELRKIAEFVSTPVIFMTAKAQASEIKEYIAMGALDVITKPFDPLKLPSTIQNIWNGKT